MDNQANGSQDDFIQQLLMQALAGKQGQPDGQAPISPVSPQEKVASSGSAGGTALAEDRPSFGSRLGAPAAMVAPLAPVPKPTPDAPPQVQFDPSKMPDIFGSAQNKMPPSPPTGTRNPSRMDLIRQEGEYGKPLARNAVDPATGKPKYKMGWGARLLGTVGNALSGFATKGQDTPVYVGPGARNNRYYQDEATREGNLANVKTQLGEQEKLDTSNEKMYQDATKQAYESQLGEARGKIADASATNAETRSQLATTTEELNRAKADNIGPKTPTNEFAGWYESFKNDKGRPPTAKEILDHDVQLKKAAREGRQPSELEVWKDAFQRDNGREPTADEISQRKAKTRGTPEQFTQVEQKKQQALSTAEKEYKKAIGQALTNEDRQAAVDDLNEAKQRAQTAYETELQSLGGPSAAAPSKPAPAATKPTPATVKPPAKNEARVSGRYLGPDDPKRGLKKGQTVTLPQSHVDAAIKAGQFERM